jgi:DNA-binding NarL/FixJ family response regulator
VLQDLPGDARARLPTVARRWGLTPRQSSVLLLVAEGASNRSVAEKLACSEKTVELHVSALLAKTRSQSRAQLVAAFWTEPQ